MVSKAAKAAPLSEIRFCGPLFITEDQCRFKVWAPLKDCVDLHLLDPDERVPMQKDDEGYFTTVLSNIKPGRNYFFVPDGEKDVPDPASHYQPHTVHGPSQVVNHNKFQWNDQAWRGLPFKDLILYELHVGTFTDEGTFEAVIPRLDDLVMLGVNALEIMPVAQFPGNRNWGYDGVLPFAVQNSYGGPDGLKKLVDVCHSKGIAVFLDVVYNHLGPEGNYFSAYGPYFTDSYCTPWGDAINFDGEWSDGVREFFCNNALYWFEFFHVDGLRLDAVHMAFDNSAVHFWKYLNEKVKALQEKLGRSLHLIAESDLNSPRIVHAPAIGGFGFTAQWLDDFHHALYVMLDSKGRERYIDFGRMEQLAKAYTDGFVHSGEFVKFRKRKHGVSSAGIPGDNFVIFTLNHDQVGNRPLGERLSLLVGFERLKLAAAAMLLAPYVPMLFMGEEYGEQAPFFYFVSHSDKNLIEAVRKGRKEEFKDFNTEGESPDPQDEKTFTESKLRWSQRGEGSHAVLLKWYKKLISLRKELSILKSFDKNNIRAHALGQSGLVIYRQSECGNNSVVCLFNFTEHLIDAVIPFYAEKWLKVLDSGEQEWSEKGIKGSVMPAVIAADEKVPLLPLTVAVYSNSMFRE